QCSRRYGDNEEVARPKACFIPAQGNALGSSQRLSRRLKACFIRITQPTQVNVRQAAAAYERPFQGLVPNFVADEPRALPWAGMRDAFGVALTAGPKEVRGIKAVCAGRGAN